MENLLSSIPDNACVLAYNSSFEVQVLRNLAEQFPEHKERVDTIINNVRDLGVPFRQMDFYQWEMNGSWSLKVVLPLLVPELSYKGLEVSDGGMAMDAYAMMCQTTDSTEIEKIRKALLEYCKLDTLAMGKILEKLRGIVRLNN